MSALPRLALFDLDHTLLDGDSDQLWCEFLMDEGLLDRAAFAERNDAMERDYRAGTVGVEEFCNFYVGTLAGRSAVEWEPLRRRFCAVAIVPRFKPQAREVVRSHARAGDLVVLTTATNRVITELTARALGIAHLIATECEVGPDGRFTGRTCGTPNMRAGKVERLQHWLAARGRALADADAVFYSDSMNDLPLLEAVRHPIVVDPDPRLAALAAGRAWPVLRWGRTSTAAAPAD